MTSQKIRRKRQVLAISDVDSRYKWAKALSAHFEDSECRELSSAASRDILIRGLDSLTRHAGREIEYFDVLIFAFGGGSNFKFLRQFQNYLEKKPLSRRPILISGYNGITETNNIHALLFRTGSDIICVNSPHDHARFSETLTSLNFSSECLLTTGYVRKPPPRIATSGDKTKVLFACQPDVPKSLRERRYILAKLCQLATERPDWSITVKPRSRAGEGRVPHSETYFYQDIFKYLIREKPNNIHFDYSPIENLLAASDLCLTVASTVAVESLMLGIPTGIISDFGIRSDYGNHHFIGSGCLISFEQLSMGDLPKVQSSWLKKHLGDPIPSTDTLVRRVEHLLTQQESMGSPLPLPSMFYNEREHSYLFEPKSESLTPDWRARFYSWRRMLIKLRKAASWQ